MRTTILASALALLCAVPLIAQDKKKAQPAKPAPNVISLSGCVVRREKSSNGFTLEDQTEGKYRLTGINLRDYAEQRVQIAGTLAETKRLVIKGGLLPNPNVAAQAGAMDPVRAAVASAGGTAGPGNVELPEFKVKSVRPVSGGCPN